MLLSLLEAGENVVFQGVRRSGSMKQTRSVPVLDWYHPFLFAIWVIYNDAFTFFDSSRESDGICVSNTIQVYILCNITLSSNAKRVPFKYPQIYLNKKGKVCKTRVNEWIINQI